MCSKHVCVFAALIYDAHLSRLAVPGSERRMAAKYQIIAIAQKLALRCPIYGRPLNGMRHSENKRHACRQ